MPCKSRIAFLPVTAAAVSLSRADLATISPAEALSRPGPIGRGGDAGGKALVGTKPPEFPARVP